MRGKQFTLYITRYCHLCDEMELALWRLKSSLPFDYEVIDVDSDLELESRYAEAVPILVAHDQEVCRYHLDEQAVRLRIDKLRG